MSIKKAKKALQEKKNSDLAKSYSFIKIRNEKYDLFLHKNRLKS
jgi:molybdate-binding protein